MWTIGCAESSSIDSFLNSGETAVGGDKPRRTNEILSLLFVSELESSESALDLCVVSTSDYCCFVTVEAKCVKFWEISGINAIKLRKRVHIKQEVKRVACDALTGFIVVLSLGGKILVLDTHGNYVSTIEK